MQQISAFKGFTERQPDVILVTLLADSKFVAPFTVAWQFGALRRPSETGIKVPTAFRPKH
ncbi:hypothetical protein EOS93_20195 [Rhizobium sp. RMa-01]|uniref:hypothetical protein n=1 Tax=unclassified Rhizobium TaxID=2613769 RepID=UPI0008D9CB46|nr:MULTISPECIES: hypothetical protein [unclassified Rhizobium]OHV18444.1 hypothetical protein BBJ66_19535 [Rhizobium sp. RSm-3]RVU09180.1 hypothetical protein EOS93_20195 [Rhizobium sp. RMa-01]